MAVMTPDSAVVDLVRPSPNGRERRAGEQLRLVVVHGTWMATDEEALARLCDPAAEVSCHYYVARDGKVIQLVPEARVAHHAGKSAWEIDGKRVEGLNGWSLGIEVGNAGPFAGRVPTPEEEALITEEQWAAAEPYREEQYVALGRLLRDILQRNPQVRVEDVVGHDKVSPGRKSDPGRHFDWQRVDRAVRG